MVSPYDTRPGKERPLSRYYIKKRLKHGSSRKNPRTLPPSLAGRHRPLCNGPAGGWRAGRNPGAGEAQQADFFNQARNTAADDLSRCPALSEIYVLSELVPTWLHKLQQGNDDTTTPKNFLLLAVSLNPEGYKDYTLHSSILRLKGRVWVGNNNNKVAQQNILQALHSSGIGHSGMQATYHRVKQFFGWPALKKSVLDYVQSCEICQKAKTDYVKCPGLLQPLQIPQQTWEIVSLDFIEGLPISERYNTIGR